MPVAFTVYAQRTATTTSVSLDANDSGVNSVTSTFDPISLKNRGTSPLPRKLPYQGTDAAGGLRRPVDLVGELGQDGVHVAAPVGVVQALDGFDLGIGHGDGPVYAGEAAPPWSVCSSQPGPP